MKPESITKRGKEIPVCQHGDCEAHCIWDYSTCWDHLTKKETAEVRERISIILRDKKDLSGLVLTGADLKKFDFSGADMSDTFIDQCDFSKALFVETNLTHAYLGWSNLEGADLSRAELDSAVFTHAILYNVKLLAYSISFGRIPLNITKDSFNCEKKFTRSRINESDPYTTEATYQALKTHFINNGDYDSASWAAYSERLMQRNNYYKSKKYLKWSGSFLFGAISGYGEKPIKVIYFVLSVLIIYSLAYFLSGTLICLPDKSCPSFAQVIYFSTTTFCTMTVPGFEIKQTVFGLFLVSSEAFLGLISLSLFIFTLTRRFVAR